MHLFFSFYLHFYTGNDFVVMSDSDDDNDDNSDDDDDEEKKLNDLATEKELLRIKEEDEKKAKKERMIQSNKIRILNLNPRNLMKNVFKKKVNLIAKENYCKQEKILSSQLNVKLEIYKNCRLLVELLTDKKKRKMIKTSIKRQLEKEALDDLNEQRRLLYQQQVYGVFIH